MECDGFFDANHFQIDQALRDNSELFRFTSFTNYYQESSAAEQAQKVGDQNRVLHLFKTGEFVRGQFRYQEVETGFIILFGHVDRLTMFGVRKKIGANLWKEKHYENHCVLPWMSMIIAIF